VKPNPCHACKKAARRCAQGGLFLRIAEIGATAQARNAISGLPPALARDPSREPEPRPERSGALYRRGAYGLDGKRANLDTPAAASRARKRPEVAVIGAGHVGVATGSA
jgi:hypothetical protein